MSGPILGRAYPALLTPGLRVVVLPVGQRGDGYDGLVVERVDGGAMVVGLTGNPVVKGWVWCVSDQYLRIDYADPHTRDRVCRALAAHYGTVESGLTAEGPMDVLPMPVRHLWTRMPAFPECHEQELRNLADAVWGEAAPEVSGG